MGVSGASVQNETGWSGDRIRRPRPANSWQVLVQEAGEERLARRKPLRAHLGRPPAPVHSRRDALFIW